MITIIQYIVIIYIYIYIYKCFNCQLSQWEIICYTLARRNGFNEIGVPLPDVNWCRWRWRPDSLACSHEGRWANLLSSWMVQKAHLSQCKSRAACEASRKQVTTRWHLWPGSFQRPKHVRMLRTNLRELDHFLKTLRRESREMWSAHISNFKS